MKHTLLPQTNAKTSNFNKIEHKFFAEVICQGDDKHKIGSRITSGARAVLAVNSGVHDTERIEVR